MGFRVRQKNWTKSKEQNAQIELKVALLLKLNVDPASWPLSDRKGMVRVRLPLEVVMRQMS